MASLADQDTDEEVEPVEEGGEGVDTIDNAGVGASTPKVPTHSLNPDGKTAALHARVHTLIRTSPVNDPKKGGGEVVRKFLHCEDCSKGRGICDSCKKIFLSDEWRELNSDWSKRKSESPRRRKSSVVVQPPAALTAPMPKTEKEKTDRLVQKLIAEKRELQAALDVAEEKNQELADELDGYKRALKFARNFIESETVEYKNRKKESTVHSKVTALVEMYRKQLQEVTQENNRLAEDNENKKAAIEKQSMTIQNLIMTKTIDDFHDEQDNSEKVKAGQNGNGRNTAAVHTRQVESAGAFTWELNSSTG
jgi:hypothetical protein